MAALSLKRRDVGSAKLGQSPFRSGLLGEKHGTVEHVRRKDELEVALSNAVADVKHPATVADIRDGLAEENGVKVTSWHGDTSLEKTPERGNVALTHVNNSLQPKVGIDAQPIAFRPVIFVGYDERQIPPIPLFALPRNASPVVAGNGRSEPITSLRPHLSTMEN